MTTDSDLRSARLGVLRQRLEEVLATFEGDQCPEAATIGQAWERMNAAFESYREAWEAAVAPAGPALRAEIEHVLRLHAVATSIVARHRDSITAEFDTLARVRTRLEALPRGASAGRSCDVVG
jgi:hypothetical protein